MSVITIEQLEAHETNRASEALNGPMKFTKTLDELDGSGEAKSEKQHRIALYLIEIYGVGGWITTDELRKVFDINDSNKNGFTSKVNTVRNQLKKHYNLYLVSYKAKGKYRLQAFAGMVK